MTVAETVALSTLIAGRVVDLLGTRASSPDLALESNAWMRRLGWRGTLVVNGVVVLVLALLADLHTWIWLGVFSALLGLRNAQLAWLARALGPETYGAALGKWLRSASLRTILPALALESGVLIVLGTVVMDGSEVSRHERLWYLADVGRGILFCGVFVGLLRAFELYGQRRRRAGPEPG